MYAKVIKIVEWILLVVSVAIALFGAFYGFEKGDAIATDVMLYWAYAMVAVGVLFIIFFGIWNTARTNPKGLIKLAGVLLGSVAIVAIAYFVAPGTEAVGLSSAQPEANILKWTDTILILTYASCAVAVLSILFGVIINAIRK